MDKLVIFFSISYNEAIVKPIALSFTKGAIALFSQTTDKGRRKAGCPKTERPHTSLRRLAPHRRWANIAA